MRTTRSKRDEFSGRPRSGVALLMTLFIVLIVAAVILQLSVTTSAEYAVSGNEAVIAKLESAAESALVDARQALIDDAQPQEDTSGGAGAGIPGIPGAGGGDPNAPAQNDADSLNDTWANDQETSVSDNQVKIHIEDENRKFNILSLVSKDQEYARASRERLVRIVDLMREFNGSEKDIDSSYAETIAANIQQWLEGNRKNFERPNLHSNKPDTTTTLPLTLDELQLLDGIDEDIFYDQKRGKHIYPGLESVLTIWTSIEAGAIKNTNDTVPDPAAPANPGSPSVSTSASPPTDPNEQQNNEAAVKDPSIAAGKSGGVKININTAPPCILRALAPNYDIPAEVWDAVIRFRNQLDEEKLKKAQEAGDYVGGEFPPGVDPATKIVDRTFYGQGESGPATQFFSSLDDLNKIDEWKNCSNETAKKDLLKLLTTKSDVFSIYITVRPTTGRGAVQSQSVDAFGFATTTPGADDPDDAPGGIVRRLRQIVWRRTSEQETVLLPLIVREERFTRKVSIPEFPVDPQTGEQMFR
ncbi:MAG: hypothetical protein ACKVS6_14055 [Planctomycetota bacterium]